MLCQTGRARAKMRGGLLLLIVCVVGCCLMGTVNGQCAPDNGDCCRTILSGADKLTTAQLASPEDDGTTLTDTLTTSEDYEVFFSIKIPEQTTTEDVPDGQVFHPVLGKLVKEASNGQTGPNREDCLIRKWGW